MLPRAVFGERAAPRAPVKKLQSFVWAGQCAQNASLMAVVAGAVAGGAAVSAPGARAGVGDMGQRCRCRRQRGGAPGHRAATFGAAAKAQRSGGVRVVGGRRRLPPAAAPARQACGGADSGLHVVRRVE